MDNEKFTIEDVINLCGLNIEKTFSSDRGVQALLETCPHCGCGKGKFYANLSKSLFCCHKCGFTGNALKLYKECNPSSDYEGPDGNKHACRDIYAQIRGESYVREFRQKSFERLQLDPVVERAEDAYCSMVYRAMLHKLKLREEHKKELLGKRGLKEDQIAMYLFRSTPFKKEAEELCRYLVQTGFELEGVPGFFWDNEIKGWNIKFNGSGYLIPVFDGERNLILGFQIHLDNPFNGNKYTWFTSTGKEKGTGCGALCARLPGKEDSPFLVVEGTLKALLVYAFLDREITVLSVPGTTSLNGLKSYFDDFSGDMLMFDAFDMDRYENENVMRDNKKLIDIAESFDIMSESLKWDFNEEGEWKGTYKGLDDMLLALNNEQRSAFIARLRKKYQDQKKLNAFFAEQN